MRPKHFISLLLTVLAFVTSGCGAFVARRIAQAPNSYPTWFAPKARVELDFGSNFLTNFPAQFVAIGPPSAKMRYRVIEPADYQLELTSSNWLEHDRPQYKFGFNATVPGKSNAWSGAPRGTVVLLHGWGLGQFAMAPWALRLAQDGWRCVLVDLRGHGKSTGDRIYFGMRETADLSQLLDELTRQGQLVEPVEAVGESYGAALALRWKGAESRVDRVVAIAPYASLSNAVMNIRHDYAAWVPGSLIRAGLKDLPALLGAQGGELDPVNIMTRKATLALLVAGADDQIAPPGEVRRVYQAAAPGSEMVVVPHASHEALTYFFGDLAPVVTSWLAGQPATPVITTDTSR